ncbi:DUF4332 domain-containing protein [Clostridiaceae bacterium M8S5]|nr:DUF4332 domain-containing protein [Clostridiaceae bacterium M8S5]
MSIFDNLQMQKLPIVLKEESLLKRYYGLVPIADKLSKAIINCGIKDTQTFLKVTEDVEGINKIINRTGLEEDIVKLLRGTLIFQRFRTVKLKKIDSFKEEYVRKLEAKGIKDNGQLMLLSQSRLKRKILSEQTEIPINELDRMISISDLMRLPGVKNIRASLYLNAGFKNIKQISKLQPIDMINIITEYINNNGISKKPPLPKEVSTQILWAKVYPKIID